MQTRFLIYIHGFNSSSRSIKAHKIRLFLEKQGATKSFVCPTLPHLPFAAIATLESIIESIAKTGDRLALIGSSLGGYYATWLAEKYASRVVLINPAIKPYELLNAKLGKQRNPYTNESYELSSLHIEQLKLIEVAKISFPDRFYLMVQTGDEILDYRDAVEKYRGAKKLVVSGGDHSFHDFDTYIPRILRFLDN